jgi:hypothetical protein
MAATLLQLNFEERTISTRFARLGYTGSQTNDKVAQQLCSLEPPLTGEGKQPHIRNLSS